MTNEKAAIMLRLAAMLAPKYEPEDVVADLRTLAMGLLIVLREDCDRSSLARGILARVGRWRK